MNITCSTYIYLGIFVGAVVLTAVLIVVRSVRVQQDENQDNQHDSSPLIIGFLVIAFLSISALLFYTMLGPVPC